MKNLLIYRIIFFNFILFLSFIFSTALVITFQDHFGLFEYSLFLVMLFLQQIGVEVGLHRYLSHQSFKTSPLFSQFLMIMACMGGQGSPHFWVANHRFHHQQSDLPGDPHSPYAYGRGLLNFFKGFFHSHYSWIVQATKKTDSTWLLRYAPDLFREKYILRIYKYRHYIFYSGLILPALICESLALHRDTDRGPWLGFLFGLLVCGLTRVFIGLQIVYSINSLGHIMGTQDYETRDQSRNSLLLSIFTFGASWHNNHHAFPSSAFCGIKWWQIDIMGLFILILEKFGIVWNVRRPASKKLVANLN